MTAQAKNLVLLTQMEGFLQKVNALTVSDGTAFLPTGGLEAAREMSSDAYFAGEATPEARLVTRIGAFIDQIDAQPLARSGAHAIPAAMVHHAASLISDIRHLLSARN